MSSEYLPGYTNRLIAHACEEHIHNTKLALKRRWHILFEVDNGRWAKRHDMGTFKSKVVFDQSM